MNVQHAEHRKGIEQFLDSNRSTERRGKGFRGLSSAEAEAAYKEMHKLVGISLKYRALHHAKEIISEPINVLMLIMSAAMLAIYITSPEEKEHLTACAFTTVIMALNILFEVYNQWKLRRLVRSNVSHYLVQVYRDGAICRLRKEELVPGDVIVFEKGDLVLADCRLIETNSLCVDASVLTNMAEAVQKDTEDSALDYLDARNMVFNSNVIVAGKGVGVVLRTGGSTEICRVNEESAFKRAFVKNDIDSFFKASFVVASALAIVFIVYCAFFDYSILQMASIVVGAYVSILPEGIPSLMKLLLYCGALKLRKRGVFVQDMSTVQRLAEISFLCIEKDVLLVPGELVFESIYNGEYMISVDLAFQEAVPAELEYLQAIGRICFLIGNSSESLAERSSAAQDDHLMKMRRACETAKRAMSVFGNVCHEYFGDTADTDRVDSELWIEGLHITVVDKGRYLMVYAVGRPADLLEVCNARIKRGRSQKLNCYRKNCMKKIFNKFERRGYQLIGIACVSCAKTAQAFTKRNFTFISYICCKEMIHPDAPMVLSLAQGSGTNVCIINRGPKKALYSVSDALLDSMTNTNEMHMCVAAQAHNTNKRMGPFIHYPDSPANEDLGQYASRITNNRISVRGRVGERGGSTATSDADDQDSSLFTIKGFVDTIYDNICTYDANGDAFSNDLNNKSINQTFMIYNARNGQKVEIVEKLQNAGYVVAYCGLKDDDLLAMAKADVGITNATASAICKEGATVILPEHSIEGIIYSLEEGRLYFVNLQKAIRFIMMHITPQIISLSLFVFLGVPLPISPILLIFLNYFIEVLPAIYFAYEDPEYNLITSGPKSLCSGCEDFAIGIGHYRHSSIARLMQWLTSLMTPIGENSLYSSTMIRSSIGEIGMIASASCIASFFVALYHCGITFSHCFFVAGEYFQYHAPPLDLGNGVVLNFDKQLYILYRAQSTFFLALVICQFANLLVSRRTIGFVHTNFLANCQSMLVSFAGAVISCILIYMPWFEDFLLIRKPVLGALIIPVCTALFIIGVDYAKKLKFKTFSN